MGVESTDPFALGLFGGLPKTAIDQCLPSMSATIPLIDTKTGAEEPYFAVLAKKLSFERRSRRRYLSGENSSMTAGNVASTARCLETKGHINPRSLSDRLTQSLISAGLVKGITPTSIRGVSNQPIRVLAFDTPGGVDAVRQRAA